MSKCLWGIDLGGTKIEAVILPPSGDPAPILRTRINTEAHKGYEHIIRQISTILEAMKKESGLHPDRIGIGTPGVLDPFTQLMKNSNTTALNGKPLKKDLENILQIPVVIANDANCFALAETQWGAVKQLNRETRLVFGIIMGTGVGGGIVYEGKIWNGHHGIGGEWGHIFLDESGGDCYCGNRGCVETILSGPALQRYYESLTGSKRSLKEIASLKNDAAAEKTLQRLSYFFGKAVSIITNLLDPDVIVVGGGVGNIDIIYSEGVKSLGQFIFNNRLSVPVIKPALGDSAGVFGAAALTNIENG